jgi:hypothetical protein
MDISSLEEENVTLSRNVGIKSPNDAAPYPRRRATSASEIFSFYKHIILTNVAHFSKLYYYTSYEDTKLSDTYVIPGSEIRASAMLLFDFRELRTMALGCLPMTQCSHQVSCKCTKWCKSLNVYTHTHSRSTLPQKPSSSSSSSSSSC